MKILMVHAHPEKRSFCSALFNQAHQQFLDQGHNVKISDLYEMNWNPVASRDDFSHIKDDYLVYALEQRNATKEGSFSPDIMAELEKLLWADVVMFSFPLFWGSVPAILKGWIDRVFVSGICYGGKRFYEKGGLAGKKALVCCTAGGKETMFTQQAIHQPLDDILCGFLRYSLYYVGMDVLKPFYAYHVPYISDDARQTILIDFKEYLRDLSLIDRLSYPKLNEFEGGI